MVDIAHLGARLELVRGDGLHLRHGRNRDLRHFIFPRVFFQHVITQAAVEPDDGGKHRFGICGGDGDFVGWFWRHGRGRRGAEE